MARVITITLTLLSSLLLNACNRADFPAFENITRERNLVVGQPISPIRLTNTGDGNISSCTSNPELPAGVTVQPTADGSSCEIVGTPTTSTSRTLYTIEGTNRRGARSATITLTVFAMLINPSLVNAASEQSYSSGTEITQFLFDNNGGESIISCTVNPALPAGLVLKPDSGNSTCAISGRPTATSSRTSYTVTATNAIGVSSAVVIIAVSMGATPNDVPALRSQTIPELTQRQSIEPVVFENTGGSPQENNGCRSDPLLPNGLSISRTTDGRSCQITGQPTISASQRSYRITAENEFGESTVTISITVASAPTLLEPSLVAPTINPLIAGQQIQPSIVFVNNGGAPDSCTSNITLPSNLMLGLTADSSTCQITGTPMAAQTRTEYMITATNTEGSSTVTISLVVNSQ